MSSNSRRRRTDEHGHGNRLYARIAKCLIQVGDNVPAARRYLTVLKRQAKLQGGIEEAEAVAREDSVLTEVGFIPPLSVAGCSSDVVVRAEKMSLDEVPLLTEPEAKGQHCGTHVADVIHAIHRATGRKYSEREVLEMYGKLMIAHPKRLARHPIRRYAVIPTLVERLETERKALELTLRAHVVSEYDETRFSVGLHGNDLASAIAGREWVVVGCTPGGVRLNGTPVPSLRQQGCGLAVLATKDLQSLIYGENPVVVLEVRRRDWVGATDHAHGRTPSGNRRFRFYNMKE